MIISVSTQAYIFLCSIVGGMAIALLYDIFRIFRRAVKTGYLAAYAQDLLYWIIAALLMLATIYYSNDGEIRIYQFIGAFIGAVLYVMLFSRIVMGSSLFIIRVVTKVIKTILFILIYPFRLIHRILGAPARRLKRLAGKSLGKIKSNSKVRLSKLIFFKRALRNIRKKI